LPSDPLILGFDTSAAHCAAALLSGDTLLAQAHQDMARGQAEALLPMLDWVLSQGGAAWGDLAALGVGVGPGNFTGIRISVALARGLALGLGIPAIGVSLFDAKAHGLPRPLAVVEDARRGEVYVQEFMPQPEPPLLVNTSDVHGFGAFPVTGSAAAAWAAGTGGNMLAEAYPLAEAIARVALTRLGTAQARPAPLYIRAADAAPSSAPPVPFLPS
jgi:tRNA threonylcarbamoyladenosine biosynthesis protein TsaB